MHHAVCQGLSRSGFVPALQKFPAGVTASGTPMRCTIARKNRNPQRGCLWPERNPGNQGQGPVGLDQVRQPTQPRTDHRPIHLGHSLMPRRRRMRQHPLQRVPGKTESPACRPLRHPLDPYRPSNLRPVFHVRVHSRSASFARDGPFRLAGDDRSLRPGALRNSSARPAPRFCSALYRTSGNSAPRGPTTTGWIALSAAPWRRLFRARCWRGSPPAPPPRERA